MPEFLKRRSQIWPAPILGGDRNLPTNWEDGPTSEVVADWGYFKIVAGTTDITEYRGIPTLIDGLTESEPFGPETLTLNVQSVHPMEPPPAWLSSNIVFVPITIYKVKPDLTEEVYWEGFIASHGAFNDDSSYGLRVECAGAMYQMDFFLAKPPITPQGTRDLGEAIAFEFLWGQHPSSQIQELDPVPVTGITTNKEGEWDPVLTGHIQDLLAQGVVDDGSDYGTQWTLMLDPGKIPKLRLKDMTTVHWQVRCGTPGVECDIDIDRTQGYNIYYGEGINPHQCRWRNVRHDEDVYPLPFFFPLGYVAWADPVRPITPGSDQFELNPDFDPSLLRIERHENHGANIEFADAAVNAGNQLTRTATPGYMGTITLKIDPENGHRLDIKAGQNILFKNFREGDRLFHIVHREVDSEGNVTLSVDTRGRDYLTFAEMRERNRDAENPSWRRPRENRNSRQVEDRFAVWDCESGAGIIPAQTVTRGAWHIYRFWAAAGGTVVRTELNLSVGARFAAGVFDSDPTGGMLGNPLAEVDDYWDGYGDNLVIAWGQWDQAAGYHPGRESDDDPVTGAMVDDASWYYESQSPPWLWLAVWVEGAGTCTLSGRMYPGLFS